MRPAHRRERRGAGLRRAAVVAALLGTVSAAALGLAPGSLALFTDRATVTSAGFSSGSVATTTPAATQTGVSGSTSTATLSWAATAVGTNGATARAYKVYRYAAASGGTGTLVCSTSGALTCADTSAPLSGTVYYGLRSEFNGWNAEGGRAPYTADGTAPTAALSRPVAGSSQTATNLRTTVGQCSPAGIACGTAADAGGVAKVEYTLSRTAFLNPTSCWSGTAWGTTTCGFQTATGTTAWTVPGAPGQAYPSGLATWTYTLQVRATDSFGNASTTSFTWTASFGG